jgi:hypothetical protein
MQDTIKVRVDFDGWHCLSRKQKKEILTIARNNFLNANFCEETGLLIEDTDHYKIHKFCIDILESFKISLGNWDGYKISKLSRRVFFNYADRKRKLNFEYFKILIKDDLQKTKLILAGILYLDPEEVVTVLSDYERESNKLLNEMSEEQLDIGYRTLILFASSKSRSFSLL